MAEDKIDPGPGYRLLRVGEIKPEGYEKYMGPDIDEGWWPGLDHGGKVEEYHRSFRVKVSHPTEEEIIAALDAEDHAPILDPKTKYLRDIYPVDGQVHTDGHGKQFVRIDVYSVLKAFGVDHPTGHAVKKLLCAGLRGKGNRIQDLTEAKVAIDRAIQDAEVEG